LNIVHGLAFALLAAIAIGFPLWDRSELRHLRATSDPNARIPFYCRAIAVEWIVALCALALIGARDTFTFTFGERPSWLPPNETVIGFSCTLALALVVPMVLARSNARIRAALEKQIAANPLFPTTGPQRRIFLLVSLTAGICEEMIFRGFAIHAFGALLPTAGLVVALALASALFGIAHAGQGPSGMVVTAIFGAMFGALYLATGSLLLPIILHVIADARFVLLPARR